MNGAFYCRSELTAPWGMTLPPMPGSSGSTSSTSGRALARGRRGRARALLRPGDLALVPHGEGHGLRSEPGAPAPGILDLEREAVSDRYEILRHGGGGAPTTLICGAVRFDHPAARHLVELLPAVDPRRGGGSPQLRVDAEHAAADGRRGEELRPGGEAVITRLGDILVIQAIRAWIETDPAARTGWLGALQDPQIGRAHHADPPRPGARLDASPRWRASSRCRARRSPPASPSSSASRRCSYVARWRMHVARRRARARRARRSASSPSRLGYRSEAAFARAFKRVVGAPPGAVRRRAAAEWQSLT